MNPTIKLIRPLTYFECIAKGWTDEQACDYFRGYASPAEIVSCGVKLTEIPAPQPAPSRASHK